ncbi:MAG TPA: hypothetical protein PL064_03010, partial [Thermogutta sp.]|nr:hypothetical protein [Thermogutta sp.]
RVWDMLLMTSGDRGSPGMTTKQGCHTSPRILRIQEDTGGCGVNPLIVTENKCPIPQGGTPSRAILVCDPRK